MSSSERISDAWVDETRRQIRLHRVAPAAARDGVEHKHTTCLSVVDRDGNAISLMNSLFASFGSGIVAPKRRAVAQPRHGLLAEPSEGSGPPPNSTLQEIASAREASLSIALRSGSRSRGCRAPANRHVARQGTAC